MEVKIKTTTKITRGALLNSLYIACLPLVPPKEGKKTRETNPLHLTTSMTLGKLKTRETGKKYIICQAYHVLVTFVVPCSEKQGSDLSRYLSVSHKEQSSERNFHGEKMKPCFKKESPL